MRCDLTSVSRCTICEAGALRSRQCFTRPEGSGSFLELLLHQSSSHQLQKLFYADIFWSFSALLRTAMTADRFALPKVDRSLSRVLGDGFGLGIVEPSSTLFSFQFLYYCLSDKFRTIGHCSNNSVYIFRQHNRYGFLFVFDTNTFPFETSFIICPNFTHKSIKVDS